MNADIHPPLVKLSADQLRFIKANLCQRIVKAHDKIRHINRLLKSRGEPVTGKVQIKTAEKYERVILESPYAGDIPVNLEYAQRAIRDCIVRGETPYASHIMLTSALDDTDEDERDAGIMAGLYWGGVANKIVVYTDLGTSNGMKKAIKYHSHFGRTIEYRKIGK